MIPKHNYFLEPKFDDAPKTKISVQNKERKMKIQQTIDFDQTNSKKIIKP